MVQEYEERQRKKKEKRKAKDDAKLSCTVQSVFHGGECTINALLCISLRYARVRSHDARKISSIILPDFAASAASDQNAGNLVADVRGDGLAWFAPAQQAIRGNTGRVKG